MGKITFKMVDSCFRDEIFQSQNKEGNYNVHVQPIIGSLLENVTKENFFQEFVNVCREYNVDYHYFEESKDSNSFKIIITLNGYDYFEMSCNNFTCDFSKEFARVLYKVLCVAIKNEQYLQSLNKK